MASAMPFCCVDTTTAERGDTDEGNWGPAAGVARPPLVGGRVGNVRRASRCVRNILPARSNRYALTSRRLVLEPHRTAPVAAAPVRQEFTRRWQGVEPPRGL